MKYRRHTLSGRARHWAEPVSGDCAAICCADDRAAPRHDSINAVAIENCMIARWKKPFESIAEAEASFS
jgi:hypothetical protein